MDNLQTDRGIISVPISFLMISTTIFFPSFIQKDFGSFGWISKTTWRLWWPIHLGLKVFINFVSLTFTEKRVLEVNVRMSTLYNPILIIRKSREGC